MRKLKRKRKNLQAGEMLIAVPWYVPQEWARVKAAAIDPERFEETFPEWEAMETEHFERLRAEYPNMEKVFVVADEFLAWCYVRALAIDAAARAEFAAEKLQSAAKQSGSHR